MNGGEDSYAETPLQLAAAAGRYRLPSAARVPGCPKALPAPLHSSPTLAGPEATHLALKPLLPGPGGPPSPYPSVFLLCSTPRQVPAERHCDVDGGSILNPLVF